MILVPKETFKNNTMKNFLAILVLTSIISCNKDKEKVDDVVVKDSVRTSVLDSTQIPTIQNADQTAAFNIVPQNVSSEKGRAVFSKDGNVFFYFDQNSNTGNIKIDGTDYVLNASDFNENIYKITGKEVSIEATNGDFKDNGSDCVAGVFPNVKVILGDKTVNVTNVEVLDCPAN